MTIRTASTDDEILSCHRVMRQLRPHVGAQEWVRRVHRQQQEGYQLAMLLDGDDVVAVAGYRLAHNLAWGKFLYVDDLVTDASRRSSSYGGGLLEWLVQTANAAGCDELHLDSGVQRFGAHRFYLRHGLDITSHHFRIVLDRSTK